jgi:hypothetical protein
MLFLLFLNILLFAYINFFFFFFFFFFYKRGFCLDIFVIFELQELEPFFQLVNQNLIYKLIIHYL